MRTEVVATKYYLSQFKNEITVEGCSFVLLLRGTYIVDVTCLGYGHNTQERAEHLREALRDQLIGKQKKDSVYFTIESRVAMTEVDLLGLFQGLRGCGEVNCILKTGRYSAQCSCHSRPNVMNTVMMRLCKHLTN